MRVYLYDRRKTGDTMEFIVYDLKGNQYVVSNCHRTESPFWRSHNITCFHGNIDDGKKIRIGGLRIYPDKSAYLIYR